MATTPEFATYRLHGSFIPPMTLDLRSETPLYRQISIWFQRAILAGQLRPGQRVPSTRALARGLGISRIPVLGAYELLIAEGYFEPFVGAGTCVSRSVPDAFSRPDKEGLPDLASIDAQSKGRRTGSRRAEGMRGSAQMWLRGCRGCTDLEHFPIRTWSQLVSRHSKKMSRDIMGYGDTMGYWPFREAIAEYLGAFRAVNCHPSQVLVTTGSQQALQISALALLDPKDEAWIEEPGYPGTHQALKTAGARLMPIPVDEHGLDVEYGIRTADRARAAFVTPARQYPMGITMSASRRIELLNWATRNGAWIVEDDYDSEFRFSGNPIASLQGLDTDGRVIYVGTLTKVMYPTLRLGFAVIPTDLVESFLDLRNATDTVATSVLYQMAMTDFIREGHFARHIKKMRAVYMERRKVMAEAVRSQAGGVLDIVGDEAGLYLLTLLPPGVDDLEVVERAYRMMPVGPLSRCHASRPGRAGLMLGYANISVREIPAMVRDLIPIVHACMPKRGH
ncbi:MAG TPA: PLP-dependent aminotransferase family protein [Steroidobacteraceae bacterium]|nr:PLP-dependent aminotransferase family protein [Steroidobacteraceae bacterium]